MFILQLIVNLYIFFLGVLGVLTNRRHFLVIIICIEMMLLSINMSFLLFMFLLIINLYTFFSSID